DEADLVAWLREPPRRDRALFAIGSPQLLYFLVGTPSALQRDEFTFFLTSAGALPSSRAATMVDQGGAIATLEATQPLVVDGFSSAASVARLRAAFPVVAGWIDSHYRPVAQFGRYTVLDRIDLEANGSF